MNPYGPEFQTEFCCFSREHDLNSKKKRASFTKSPLDRYVPGSSPAKLAAMVSGTVANLFTSRIFSMVLFVGGREREEGESERC